MWSRSPTQVVGILSGPSDINSREGLFTEALLSLESVHCLLIYPVMDTHVPRPCDSQDREIQVIKTDANHNDFKKSYKIIYA